MNTYRLIRLLLTFYFLLYPFFSSFIDLNPAYKLPFLLAGIYLISLHILALVIVITKSENFKKGIKSFFSAFKFWKFDWPNQSTGFKFYAPQAKKVHIRGSFNSWSMTALKPNKSEKGLWSLSLKLKPGKHEYLFCIDGNCMLDQENMIKEKQPDGKYYNIKFVEDFITLPKVKVDIRNNFIRSLIIVVGFVMAFTAKDQLQHKSGILLFSIGSIISGLLYYFILSGGIDVIEEREGITTIKKIHEDFLEVLLNIQVVLLIIGLSLLIH